MSVVRSLRGQLLVSGPSLVDPNFRHTVVLLGEHGDEGAMGIVLNRRSEVAVGDAVPPLAALVGQNELVYLGGPVQPEAVVVLADFAEPGRAGQLVLGSVGLPPRRARRGRRARRPSRGAGLRRLRRLGARSARGRARGGLLARLSGPELGRLHRATGRPVARRAPPRRRKIRTSRLASGRSTRQLTHVALET